MIYLLRLMPELSPHVVKAQASKHQVENLFFQTEGFGQQSKGDVVYCLIILKLFKCGFAV